MVERREHVVDRSDRREQVVVGDHHALRRAGRARGEDQVPDVLGAGVAATRVRPVASQSAGTPSPSAGLRDERRRPSSSGSRRDRPPPGPARPGRCRGSGGAARRGRRSPAIASGLIRRSSGTRIRPGPHRPEVDGGQRRARRAPGQDPVAGLEAELARGAATRPARLRRSSSRIRPRRPRSVVVPQPERRADPRTARRRRRAGRAGSAARVVRHRRLRSPAPPVGSPSRS